MNKQPIEQPSEESGQHPIGHMLECVPGLAEPDYSVFAQWMDGELEKLVARWLHLAAPRASRLGRSREHF